MFLVTFPSSILENIEEIFQEKYYFVFFKKESFKLLRNRGNKRVMPNYLIVPKK